MEDKFLVIDGSSLIHRAFFALPPLTTKKGLNTGAVYGFCNMLLRVISDVNPKWVAVAFDKSRVTFRTEMFAGYKAQRKETPSELSEQFPLARQLLEAMNIKVLELDGYEADDIIGTLAAKKSSEAEVIIVTGDRDELQLIDDNVKVYFTKRGITDIQEFDVEEFKKNYEGLDPLQLIDLKGLMGDASDNIPGVPGVGPKTAMKLILEYGSVEEVLQNIDRVSGKSLKEKLYANVNQALLSKELATICTEVPNVSLDLKDYEVRSMEPVARELMRELEFRNLWERFSVVLRDEKDEETFALFGEEVELGVEKYPLQELSDLDEAKALFTAMKAAKTPVYVLAEEDGELPNLFFKAFRVLFERKIYSFVGSEELWQLIFAWLGDHEQKKIFHEIKEVMKVCLTRGVKVKGIVSDLALAAYLIEPGDNSYALKRLAERYLVQSDGGSIQDMEALDSLLQDLLVEKELTKLYQDLELPLPHVLASMELAGIAVDEKLLLMITKEFSEKLADLETLAYEEAGEEFNLKSPKQLGVILFEKLHLPVIKKTKTGYSTDVSVLEELTGQHPLIETILEHRQLAKLHSTYLEGLKPLINPLTGRVHTHFQQTVTVTGRLSSTQPNLQNIPVRTEIGKRMREMFVPGVGYDWLMSCDYSQVELRVLAHIAQDYLLLDSFSKGQDVHARTAAEVFGLSLDAVTSEMRTKAKAVNFGIVYGISDYGLSRQLGITRNEAAEYIANYFERYTGVKEYMDSMVNQAREQGFVETLFGRRRYLPDIKHSNFNLRSFAERTAINTPIQGTAADIIKMAMVKVQALLEEKRLESRILLQVHDELVLEVTDEEKDLVATLVKQTMEETVKLRVPLLADVAFGKNWAETK
ncbi:MAG TPA: DNA polymerase I [Candidatus Avacidaminococcus intestinavium]|uniref:DNA polymerase I n=1 Tax=Candidatus Avacidaminococcus intestinavium TaxID=2840684 RepID=A0A9D1SL11_9FIRM|nr:DNA polymerase I [Candidatus Avacidaminococcus intestinavium]